MKNIAIEVKNNNRIINRAAATLARSTNPVHIEAAHSRIFEAEAANESLRAQEENGSGI